MSNIQGLNLHHPQSISGLNDQPPKESYALLFYFLSQLNKVEVKDTELKTFLGEARNKIGMAESKAAKAHFEEVIKKYRELENRPWWEKLVDVLVRIVMPVVMITAGVVTMDPALIMGTILTVALTESGAIDKLGTAITNGLEDAGVPKSAAEMVGSALSVVIVTLGSLGVGGAMSIETVEEELSVNLKQMLSVGVTVGTTAIGSEVPLFVQGILDAIPADDEVKKILGLTLLILMELVTVVVAIIGGGMTSDDGESQGENVLGGLIKRLTTKTTQFFSEDLSGPMEYLMENSEKIISLARYASFAVLGLGGASQVALAGLNIDRAMIEKALGNLRASLGVLTDVEKVNSDMEKQNMDDLTSLVKAFDMMKKQLSAVPAMPFDAEAAKLAQ